jgi:NAD-dependent SIR2 family protein deacetylase
LLVEVNPGPTALTPLADLILRGPAGEMLPALITAMRAEIESAS